jgi:hypothetical protein
MTHYPIIALSGFSDGAASLGILGIFTFIFILLAFAPIGALLSGGWLAVGGLIWIGVDSLIVWRLWSSVTSWGHRRTWYIGWTWAIGSAVGLSAYLGLNLIVALAFDNLRYAMFPTP